MFHIIEILEICCSKCAGLSAIACLQNSFVPLEVNLSLFHCQN